LFEKFHLLDKGNKMQMMIRTRMILFLFLIINPTASLEAKINVNPDSVLQSILDNIEGSRLSLSQAKEYALNNATSFRNAEAVYQASLGSLRKERGYFDPEVYFNLKYRDSREPASSFFSGADVLFTEQTTSQTGLRLRLPIGTELELNLNTINLRTNSQFAFLNPEYDAYGSLSFRQPLFGGFSASGRRDLTYTEYEHDAAKARFNQVNYTLSSAVEQLYWNLYTAERDYAVQILTRDRAAAFLAETELRNKAGIVGPNQVASAKTFLAEQELLLIDMREQLDTQSDQLALLIGVRPEKMPRFKVIDDPPKNFPVDAVDDIVEFAVGNNLELQAAQKEISAVHAMTEAVKWKVLPQVDLVGSLVSTGLGGNNRNIIFGNDTLRSSISGSFGDVLNQVYSRNYPGWSIGFELNLPIGLRSGLGEKDRLEAAEVSAEQRYIEMSRSIELQVRTAHRELSNGNERLRAAANAVDAAQEQVRIGMIEFQNGRITAFELVRLNEDFAIAQRRYSEALIKTINAVSKLKQLTSGVYPINKY
jgi:outer membrane protein TolC